MQHAFYKTCDKLRQEPTGERRWQEMMGNKQSINIPTFLAACDVSGILDEGETFSDWWARETAQGPTAIYKSWWRRDGIEEVYFIQTAGFEFIFCLMS